ncbi:MAG: precorrin-6A/cobalt-precorrin-6A reductase [Pseudomonadales bacterium]
MKLLLLGGTADARRLAKRFLCDEEGRDDIEIVYSVAGLVRMPDVDCEVISGGFSQFGGLQAYLEQQKIDAVLDATHPYAEAMTSTAWSVTQQLGMSYWRFHRAPWQAQAGDKWQMFAGWPQLLAALTEFKSVFLTAGQINELAVATFAKYGEQNQKQLLRTAVQPKHPLSDSMSWIKAIGPFDLENELTLMKQNQVDVLVSKNSGGKATEAKLEAARNLDIPVMMLARPALPDGITAFDQIDACSEHILNFGSKK